MRGTYTAPDSSAKTSRVSMDLYLCVWSLWWNLVAAFGLAISITGLPGPTLMVVAIVGAGAGLATGRISRRLGDNFGGGSGGGWKPNERYTAAAGAGVGAYILLALTGLGAFLGGPALLLGVLAAITSPWLLQLLAGMPRRGPASAAPVLSDEEFQAQSIRDAKITARDLQSSAQDLSYEDLCRVWRITYLPVRLAADAAYVDTLAALRQTCLDEMERRDPAAFNAWLDSRARASGTPETFLNRPGNPDGVAD